MAIPQATTDAILARCGRYCAICWKHKPLHIQLDHIVAQADGGTDDEDNLVPICIECHASKHTKTRMTRAFTAAEIRKRRDRLYEVLEQAPLRENDAAIEATLRLLDRADTDIRLRFDPVLRNGAVQITVWIENHTDQVVHIRSCEFFAPTQVYEPGTLPDTPDWKVSSHRMTHGSDQRGTVGARNEFAMHFIGWNIRSRAKLSMIPDSCFSIRMTTALSQVHSIDGAEIKATLLSLPIT